MNVCQFLTGGFKFFIEAWHYSYMPYLVGANMETFAENGFEEGAGEGLRRLEAREVREDVGVGLFGVADPAWAGRGEDRFLGVGIRYALRGGDVAKRILDFIRSQDQACLSHCVGINNPSKAVPMFPS